MTCEHISKTTHGQCLECGKLPYEYADQRGHDVTWMTAQERNALGAMTPLNRRLDELVWPDLPEEGRHFYWAVFRWAQQATAEIDRLTAMVERLQEEVRPG